MCSIASSFIIQHRRRFKDHQQPRTNATHPSSNHGQLWQLNQAHHRCPIRQDGCHRHTTVPPSNVCSSSVFLGTVTLLHCHNNMPTLYTKGYFLFSWCFNRSSKIMMLRLLFQPCEHDISCYSSHVSQLCLVRL